MGRLRDAWNALRGYAAAQDQRASAWAPSGGSATAEVGVAAATVARRAASLGRPSLAPAPARPAAVAVDLLRACPRPVRGRAAAAQHRLLLLGQPGPTGLDHAGIDDLPTHGEEAALGQHRVEPREQPGQGAGARQLLAVEPDRLGVGHRIVQRQAREAHERKRSRSWYSA